jgi:hypothetical protein
MEQPKEENSENETISKLQRKSRQQFKPRGAPTSLVQKFNPPNTISTVMCACSFSVRVNTSSSL